MLNHAIVAQAVKRAGWTGGLMALVFTLAACGEAKPEETAEQNAEAEVAAAPRAARAPDKDDDNEIVLTPEEVAAIEAFRQANEAYLAANAQKEGWQVRDSGLQYRVIKAGEGEEPFAGDWVRANFELRLIDGTVIDTNAHLDGPVLLPAVGSFRGWIEAMAVMREGDKWELVMPSKMVYGDKKRGRVPRHAAFVADIEIVEVIKADDYAAMKQAEEAAFRAAQEAYLAENARKPGVTVTESGLQYEVLVAGAPDGLRPLRTSKVEMHYEGRFIDGTVFDTTYDDEQGAIFLHPSQVAPGFEEALLLMRPGDKWRVTLPHTLAYGVAGYGKRVPPYAVLEFEIDLKEVYNGLKGIPSREWMKMQAEKAAKDAEAASKAAATPDGTDG